MIIISSSSSSLCSHSVPWLGEGCVHICLFCARWYPSSSCQVRLQRLTGLFLSQGFQLVTHSVHRLSRVLLTCPAQVHFRLLTCSITSVTLVFSLTQMFVFLSWYVMFNIVLSIFVCAAASLFFVRVVSAHVSAPYVSAGSTHEL